MLLRAKAIKPAPPWKTVRNPSLFVNDPISTRVIHDSFQKARMVIRSAAILTIRVPRLRQKKKSLSMKPPQKA